MLHQIFNVVKRLNIYPQIFTLLHLLYINPLMSRGILFVTIKGLRAKIDGNSLTKKLIVNFFPARKF